MTRLKMEDCSKLGFCVHGVRLMARNLECDWHEFLKQGVDIKDLADCDDTNVKLAIEQALIRESKELDK